jgi:hypothetical protein
MNGPFFGEEKSNECVANKGLCVCVWDADVAKATRSYRPGKDKMYVR